MEQKRKLTKEVRKELVNSMLLMLPKEISNAFEGQIEASLKVFEALLDSNFNQVKEVKQSEAKKGFGNLIINQTAGYGTRLLFRELKRSVASSL